MSIETHVVIEEITKTMSQGTPTPPEVIQAQEAPPQEEGARVRQVAGSIWQKDLLDALSAAIKAISPRSTLPILANVHITLRPAPEAGKAGKAILTCTNLEIAIRREVEASVERDGTYTVPAKLLLECVKNLPKEAQVTLTIDEPTLGIAAGKRTYRLKGMGPAEFPNWPALENDGEGSIDLEVNMLRQAIKETEFAAADDDSRPVLTGVHIEITNKRLTLAAADAFRLTMRELPLPPTSGRNVCILVPVTTMRTLADVLPTGGKIRMQWDQKGQRVLFQAGEVQVISRLIEGNFPAVRRVVPKESCTIATIDRKMLASALKGLAPIARDSSNITKLSFTRPGTVTIEATSEDVGSVSEDMEAPVAGSADGGIVLNYRYLSDVLAKLREDAFTFEFTSKDKPILIRPVGRNDYWYVVMPMSTNR